MSPRARGYWGFPAHRTSSYPFCESFRRWWAPIRGHQLAAVAGGRGAATFPTADGGVKLGRWWKTQRCEAAEPRNVPVSSPRAASNWAPTNPLPPMRRGRPGSARTNRSIERPAPTAGPPSVIAKQVGSTNRRQSFTTALRPTVSATSTNTSAPQHDIGTRPVRIVPPPSGRTPEPPTTICHPDVPVLMPPTQIRHRGLASVSPAPRGVDLNHRRRPGRLSPAAVSAGALAVRGVA